MTAPRPTLRFLFAHPAHFLALGFGAGLAPIAPGTFGTLVAIPIGVGLRAVTGDLGFLIATVALFAVGVWASAVTSRHLGTTDHGAICRRFAQTMASISATGQGNASTSSATGFRMLGRRAAASQADIDARHSASTSLGCHVRCLSARAK